MFTLCKTIPFCRLWSRKFSKFYMLLFKKYKMTNMMQDKISCLVKIQIFNAKKNYNVLIACYAL